MAEFGWLKVAIEEAEACAQSFPDICSGFRFHPLNRKVRCWFELWTSCIALFSGFVSALSRRRRWLGKPVPVRQFLAWNGVCWAGNGCSILLSACLSCSYSLGVVAAMLSCSNWSIGYLFDRLHTWIYAANSHLNHLSPNSFSFVFCCRHEHAHTIAHVLWYKIRVK